MYGELPKNISVSVFGALGVGVISLFAIVLAWRSISATVKDRLIRITGWLEPHMGSVDMGLIRVDVRRVQQSTVNQWFDEAQFESYRALGKHCLQEVFNQITNDPRKQKREALIRKKILGTTTLTSEEETLLQEMLAEERLLRAINGNRPISTESIESLFAYTEHNRKSANKS